MGESDGNLGRICYPIWKIITLFYLCQAQNASKPTRPTPELRPQERPQTTPQQEENRDFRAQAIQDSEPGWKKAARGALDAPFKDTYHELALKQQLLDAANDPEASWFGIADADTNAAMEGHSTVKDGTRLWYDEKQPSALEKLLKPFGGKVEHDNLPSQNTFDPTNRHNLGSTPLPGHNSRTISVAENNTVTPLVTALDNNLYTEDIMKLVDNKPRQLPGPGMWKANLTPEMKALIKERGFPAMAALMALQSQRDKMGSGQE